MTSWSEGEEKVETFVTIMTKGGGLGGLEISWRHNSLNVASMTLCRAEMSCLLHSSISQFAGCWCMCRRRSATSVSSGHFFFMMSCVNKIARTAQCFDFKHGKYFLQAIHCLVDRGRGGGHNFVTSFWKEGFRLLWRNVSRGELGANFTPESCNVV